MQDDFMTLRSENARLRLDNIQLLTEIECLRREVKKEREKYETLEYNYNILIEKINFYSDILRKRGFVK